MFHLCFTSLKRDRPHSSCVIWLLMFSIQMNRCRARMATYSQWSCLDYCLHVCPKDLNFGVNCSLFWEKLHRVSWESNSRPSSAISRRPIKNPYLSVRMFFNPNSSVRWGTLAWTVYFTWLPHLCWKDNDPLQSFQRSLTPLASTVPLPIPLPRLVCFGTAGWSKAKIKQALLIDSALQSQNDSYGSFFSGKNKIQLVPPHCLSSVFPHWVKCTVNRAGYFNRSL